MVKELTSEEKEFLKKYITLGYHRFRELEYYSVILYKM